MSATIIQFKRRVAPVRPVIDPLSAEVFNVILRAIEAEHQRRALATKVPAAAKPSRRRRKGPNNVVTLQAIRELEKRPRSKARPVRSAVDGAGSPR
jgi:hypothetical protein